MAQDMNRFHEANPAGDDQDRRAYIPPRLSQGTSVRELTKGGSGSTPDGAPSVAVMMVV